MLRILPTISRYQLKDNFTISKISHCFLIPTLNGQIILGVLQHYPHLKVSIVSPWLFPIDLFTRPSMFITKKPTTRCKVAHHHGPSLKKPIIINAIRVNFTRIMLLHRNITEGSFPEPHIHLLEKIKKKKF